MIQLVEPVLDHPILIVILAIVLQTESTNIFRNKLLLLELESANKLAMMTIIMNQLIMELIIFVNNVIRIV